MPAMTNILVKDDSSTPVEFTLYPISDNPNPMWRASVASVPLAAQPKITASIEKVKGGFKVSIKLEVPVLETLGSAGTSAGYTAPQKVAYVTTMITTMFCSDRSTTEDRANALKMIVGLLQGASSTTATGTLDQASAGSAYASSTAPFTAMFRDVIAPN